MGAGEKDKIARRHVSGGIFLKKISISFFPVSNAQIVGDRDQISGSDMIVKLGSDIKLTCKAKDSPEPPSSVVWYKDGTRVDSMLSRGGISVVTESRYGVIWLIT